MTEATAAAHGKSPDAFRTISEAAAELDVQAHVLRFWESKFSHIKPMKRAGGRRFYRPEDLALLRGIRTLLYEQGYTIKGAKKLLGEKGPKHVAGLADASGAAVEPASENAEHAIKVSRSESDDARATRQPNQGGLSRALETMEAMKARLDAALAGRS